MANEFDQYATGYRDIINKYASASGESFEFYIDLRIRLLARQLTDAGAPSPRRILDFGCGIGVTEVHLRRRFPDAEIVGIDASPESVRAAEGLGLEGVRFAVSHDGSPPPDEAPFDLVYSNGTFHHIDHALHPATLRRLRRATRDRGHLFVFENNPFNPVMRYAMFRSPIDRDARPLRPGYLARVVREAGFDAKAPQFYAFFPAGLRALRPAEEWLRSTPLGAQYFVWGETR